MRLLIIIWFICLPISAMAGGQYFNFTLQGSLERNIDKDVSRFRSNLGAELGVPLSNILEVSLGHSLYTDKKVYSSEYRKKFMEAYKLDSLPATLETQDQQIDTSVNMGLGYTFSYIRATVFGGFLWRRMCSEDTIQDSGCSKEAMTWNVGIGMGIYITQSLQLKVSYRISPAVIKGKYDDTSSIGITWGY